MFAGRRGIEWYLWLGTHGNLPVGCCANAFMCLLQAVSYSYLTQGSNRVTSIGIFVISRGSITYRYVSDADMCHRATRNGNLDMLQWARSQGCSWREVTCKEAAENGHLEVLQWARENGCPWNEATCMAAAQNGHLEVLQWARDIGCPWSEFTCRVAVPRGPPVGEGEWVPLG